MRRGFETGAPPRECRVASSSPKSFRVIAARDEPADALDDLRAVFAVSDTKPGIGRAQHFDTLLARACQRIHNDGNIKFSFLVLAVFLQKRDQLPAQMPEDRRGETPHVH